MTKQIEDYPELDKWLEENEEELSEGTFGFDLTCVKQKLLEMQSKIDELTEEAENSDWLAKKAVELTEQNKELQEQINFKIDECITLAKACNRWKVDALNKESK